MNLMSINPFEKSMKEHNRSFSTHALEGTKHFLNLDISRPMSAEIL